MIEKKEYYKRLLFRNQFIIGPDYVNKMENWERIEISPALKLTAHPDLAYHFVSHQKKFIVLLGFILDPYAPEKNDQEIIDDLVCQMDCCQSVIERIHDLGGRWILIVNDEKDTIVLNDAFGIRQIFYSEVSKTKHAWCASQPALIGGHLGLAENEETIDFVKWHRSKSLEHWIPGTQTQYIGIRRLLPNHLFNFKSRKVSRFWPSEPLKAENTEQVLKDAVDLLRGTMKSSAMRYFSLFL